MNLLPLQWALFLNTSSFQDSIPNRVFLIGVLIFKWLLGIFEQAFT